MGVFRKAQNNARSGVFHKTKLKRKFEKNIDRAVLKRNNKQIRDDRALAISEDTQMIFKRKIEDLQTSIKRMKRELDSMLDLSPTNAQSLVLASDFNSNDFVEKYINLGVKIRNNEITLEIAEKQYKFLFGE